MVGRREAVWTRQLVPPSVVSLFKVQPGCGHFPELLTSSGPWMLLLWAHFFVT